MNKTAPMVRTPCIRCLRAKRVDSKVVVRLAICSVCLQCDACGCICTRCTKCNRRIPASRAHYCSNCAVCRKCDTCRHMPHFVPPHRMKNVRTNVPMVINKLPRLLGIELELSDWGRLTNYHFTKLSYTQAHDWSVQPSGLEMVVSPLKGDAFIRGMIELATACEQYHATCNDSCAFHVHVDGSDLSYWEIRRLLRVYSRLEAEIYDHLILPHRRDTPSVVHYCQMMTQQHRTCERCSRFDNQYPGARLPLEPLYKTLARMDLATCTADIKACLFRMLYNLENIYSPDGSAPGRYQELQTRKGGRYEWCRYVGLNLHAWQYRGTVEWRMKEGTTSLTEMVYYPLWCGWFVQAITAMSEGDSKNPRLNLLDFTKTYMPKEVYEWVREKYGMKGST